MTIIVDRLPRLIYCADGNRKFAEIAIRRGYVYGAQLPNTVYFPPAFTDQNWKAPNRTGYMAALRNYRPALATVLDWEWQEQLPLVLDWAEEAAQYVTESVIIIPKVVGGIKQLPRMIGGKPVRLGYSCSSTFSSTPVTPSEFKGWPVHALGGGVSAQMDLHRKVEVISADGNYIQNQARKRCQFYQPGTPAKHSGWPKLREAGIFIEHDAPYIAFELTCIAVPMAWRGYSSHDIYEAQREYLRSIDKLPAHKQLKLVEAIA